MNSTPDMFMLYLFRISISAVNYLNGATAIYNFIIDLGR